MKIEKIQHGKPAPYSERFERWWEEYSETREDKKAAWAGWQASRTCAAEDLKQPDWELVSDEIREVAVLAKRHGLAIMSSPGDPGGSRVEATRHGFSPINIQVGSMRALLAVLTDMEKRGAL